MVVISQQSQLSLLMCSQVCAKLPCTSLHYRILCSTFVCKVRVKTRRSDMFKFSDSLRRTKGHLHTSSGLKHPEHVKDHDPVSVRSKVTLTQSSSSFAKSSQALSIVRIAWDNHCIYRIHGRYIMIYRP